MILQNILLKFHAIEGNHALAELWLNCFGTDSATDMANDSIKLCTYITK